MRLSLWQSRYVWIACCLFVATSTAHAKVTVLHSFNGQDGKQPSRSSLTLGSDGAFYGSTDQGGAADCGVLFRVTPSGGFSVLHDMDGGQDGCRPLPVLAEGPDGALYGISRRGGGNDRGTFFKVSPEGAFNVIASLSQFLGGKHFSGGLTLASDGKFYTVGSVVGSVYSLSASGEVARIGGLGGGELGSDPAYVLTEGDDGWLYGVADGGGEDCLGEQLPHTCGAIYRMSKSGEFESLHQFRKDEGESPAGGLVQGPDGAFYGVTERAFCGADRCEGIVFRITPEGEFSMIKGPGEMPDHPEGPLVLGRDGALYGAANVPYRVTLDGQVTLLANDSSNSNEWALYYPGGIGPYGSLFSVTQGPDGDFYGTSALGGANSCGDRSCGTVYKVSTSSGGSSNAGGDPAAGVAGGSGGLGFTALLALVLGWGVRLRYSRTTLLNLRNR